MALSPPFFSIGRGPGAPSLGRSLAVGVVPFFAGLALPGALELAVVLGRELDELHVLPGAAVDAGGDLVVLGWDVGLGLRLELGGLELGVGDVALSLAGGGVVGELGDYGAQVGEDVGQGVGEDVDPGLFAHQHELEFGVVSATVHHDSPPFLAIVVCFGVTRTPGISVTPLLTRALIRGSEGSQRSRGTRQGSTMCMSKSSR